MRFRSFRSTIESIRAQPIRFNKAGHIVLKVQDRGHLLSLIHSSAHSRFSSLPANGPIKIYEVFSEGHARFVHALSSQEVFSGFMPFPAVAWGTFIVTPWVKSPRRRFPMKLSAAAHLLAKLHTADIAQLPSSHFDYWNDYLLPRGRRAFQLLGYATLLRDAVECVGQHVSHSPLYLHHADLTPANVVFVGRDSFVVVDNELLSIGKMPWLDLCNAAYPLGVERGTQLVRSYLDVMPRAPGLDWDCLQMAWLVRRVGSMFVAGRLRSAQSIIRDYEAGDFVMPFRL